MIKKSPKVALILAPVMSISSVIFIFLRHNYYLTVLIYVGIRNSFLSVYNLNRLSLFVSKLKNFFRQNNDQLQGKPVKVFLK